MSDDAVVPEEWVEAGVAAARRGAAELLFDKGGEEQVGDVQKAAVKAALEAVVPLAEQRATRSLLKAREETEGR